MTGVPLSWYLILSAVLFTLGVAGFLLRRNVITVFMSIELMLNAVNLTFITFSYQLKQVNGHIFSFSVMTLRRRRNPATPRVNNTALRIRYQESGTPVMLLHLLLRQNHRAQNGDQDQHRN